MKNITNLNSMKPAFLLIFSILFIFFSVNNTPKVYASNETIYIVISNVDRNMYNYDLRQVQGGLWGYNYEILNPRNLDDLAEMLIQRGRYKKIEYLAFFAHGSDDHIQFRSPNQTELYKEDFKRLRNRYPMLAKAFAPGAAIELFACSIGGNSEFLDAVGDAFLRECGGDINSYMKVIIWGDPNNPYETSDSNEDIYPIRASSNCSDNERLNERIPPADGFSCIEKCKKSPNPNRCIPLCRAGRSGGEGRLIDWLKKNN